MVNATGGTGEIQLADAGNSFIGSVSLTNSGSGEVSIADISPLIFSDTSVGTGALTVTAPGISQVYLGR